jgi:hypothetical protein
MSKECSNCGCREETHPIPECKKYDPRPPLKDIERKLAIAVEALEKIANDREFTHTVSGKFVREVFYVNYAKSALKKIDACEAKEEK